MATKNVTSITKERYPTLPRLKISLSSCTREAGPCFNSSLGVLVYAKTMQRLDREEFRVFHLDVKNRMVGYEVVSVGSLNSSIVHPREVFKAVLLNNSASIICCHNHPSGDLTPSREDIEITQRLKKAADLLGIRLLDHVIIGKDGYRSLAEMGFLDGVSYNEDSIFHRGKRLNKQEGRLIDNFRKTKTKTKKMILKQTKSFAKFGELSPEEFEKHITKSQDLLGVTFTESMIAALRG